MHFGQLMPIISETVRDRLSERVINVWNSLPADAIDCTSMSKFCRSILKVNFSSFIKRFYRLKVLCCVLQYLSANCLALFCLF